MDKTSQTCIPSSINNIMNHSNKITSHILTSKNSFETNNNNNNKFITKSSSNTTRQNICITLIEITKSILLRLLPYGILLYRIVSMTTTNIYIGTRYDNNSTIISYYFHCHILYCHSSNNNINCTSSFNFTVRTYVLIFVIARITIMHHPLQI